MASCNESGAESEKPKPCPCKCGKGIAVFLVLFLLAGVACWYIHHPNRPRVTGPKPGTECTVQFRRDMIGSNSPVPLCAKGDYVSLTGTLVAVDHETILLKNTDPSNQMARYIWIPRNHILLIEQLATK